MSDGILGIPLTTWGIVCLGVAVLYFFFWPKPKTTDQPPRSRRTHFVLRWFHSIVWLLLGTACFLWAGGSSTLANVLALLALALYVIFVVTLLAERRASRPAR